MRRAIEKTPPEPSLYTFWIYDTQEQRGQTLDCYAVRSEDTDRQALELAQVWGCALVVLDSGCKNVLYDPLPQNKKQLWT